VRNRPEQTRIRATGADGQAHVAGVAEENRVTGGKVRGHNSERNLHLFKSKFLEQTLQERAHAFRTGQPQAADAPTGHIPEPHGGTDLRDFFGTGAAGERRGHDRSRAHSSDAMDRNLILFEDPQHSGVRVAAREAPSERQSDSW
jgi:hypothetical protein